MQHQTLKIIDHEQKLLGLKNFLNSKCMIYLINQIMKISKAEVEKLFLRGLTYAFE